MVEESGRDVKQGWMTKEGGHNGPLTECDNARNGSRNEDQLLLSLAVRLRTAFRPRLCGE